MELFAILAAAKSNSDEQIWLDSLKQHRASALSQNETVDFMANTSISNEKFKLFKILVDSRVPYGEDAKHILYILVELEDGLASHESWFGRMTFGSFAKSPYQKGQVCYC